MNNRRTALLLAIVPVLMFGFGYAMVPLYDVFCEALGISLPDKGRVSSDEVIPVEAGDRWVTVQFDANVNQGLNWSFQPSQNFVKVRVGEMAEMNYTAVNLAQRRSVGHAVPSVTPAPGSLYLAKTECFCFTQQPLDGGESKVMPVRFFIKPDLPDNIKVLTLSYRVYASEDAQLASN